MALSSADVIEAIIDELVMGELGASAPDIEIQRTGPGSLTLDHGTEGRFNLTVTPDPDTR